MDETPHLFHRLCIRIARGLGDRRGVVRDRADRTRDRWALFELVLEKKLKIMVESFIYEVLLQVT